MKSIFFWMHSLLEVFAVVNLCDKLVFFLFYWNLEFVLTFCTSVNSNKSFFFTHSLETQSVTFYLILLFCVFLCENFLFFVSNFSRKNIRNDFFVLFLDVIGKGFEVYMDFIQYTLVPEPALKSTTNDKLW